MKIVLQKFIADSGLCSRRKAEGMIRDGRVVVNGYPAELGMKVDKEDRVAIDGKKLNTGSKLVYIKLNKPAEYTCTNRQFKGEKNIFDLIKVEERLFAVGRLDKDSRGLVLLTNDGKLTQKLTHPRNQHEKEYITEVYSPKLKGDLTEKQVESIIKQMKQGVDIHEGDGNIQALDVEYLNNNKFKVVLIQGKKRQIRRMFQTLGFTVKDLIRTRIGKIKLGNLKEGEWEYIKMN